MTDQSNRLLYIILAERPLKIRAAEKHKIGTTKKHRLLLPVLYQISNFYIVNRVMLLKLFYQFHFLVDRTFIDGEGIFG